MSRLRSLVSLRSRDTLPASMATSDKAALQSLAFLYLTFSHATDGAVTMEEMRTLSTSLKGWAPDVALADLGEVIKSAMAEYKTFASRTDKLNRAKQYAADLKGSATPDELTRVVADLHGIAGADGDISAGELDFIRQLAADFGVASP